MPMAHASNQVALGDKIYFFRSPTPNENRCLVMAHGGQLFGDGQFPLAAGLTVFFYAPRHGDTLLSNPVLMLRGHPPRLMEICYGGDMVTNYSLAKNVGTHMAAAVTVTYEEIEGIIRANAESTDWTPHVVTIRRRFRGKGATVNLQNVITEVTNYEPAINEFYIAACRGDAHLNPLTLRYKI